MTLETERAASSTPTDHLGTALRHAPEAVARDRPPSASSLTGAVGHGQAGIDPSFDGTVLEISALSTEIALRHAVVHAVEGVSMTIAPGETFALVGESGSGKSTLALSVMRLLPHNGRIVNGGVRLCGRELTALHEAEMRDVRGHDVAMIFQDASSALDPTKTIGDQVAEPVMVHRGATKAAAFERAAEVLDLVGIPDVRNRMGDYPHQLSGGQQQRVMIAMALSCEPKLLIADEPTTALDVTIQAQILTLLDELQARLGMAILLITHDLGVVGSRADRVGTMYGGRLVETATTSELFGRMRHPYTRSLFASIPSIDQDRRQWLYSIPGSPPDLSLVVPGCRFAPRCAHRTERCEVELPRLEPVDEGHLVACFAPQQGSPSPNLLAKVDARTNEPPSAQPLVLGPTAGLGGPLEADHEQTGRRAPAEPRTAVLSAQQARKEYPVGQGTMFAKRKATIKAVSGIDIEVVAGEIFGLVGESGCGKSTLGRLLVGLERPDGGSITIEGRQLGRSRRRERRAGRRIAQMMFQDPFGSLDPRMRVGAILREPLTVQRIGSRREQDAMITSMLGEVGLDPWVADRYPHELSGGQRQRIGLARALILSPALLVADEPVSALDVSIRSQILNLIRRLQSRHHLACVVISHDLIVVKYLSDRIGVMYLGKIVELGTSEELFARPAHPYTAGLIASIELPRAQRDKGGSSGGVRGELPSPVDPPSGCRFRTRCPYAQERCASEEPALVGVKTPDDPHHVACHFPLGPAAPA